MGMGDLAVSADPQTVLTTVGLGSCVAVALLDPARRASGLAHVIFPKAPERGGAEPAKYADTAVAALVLALERIGARRESLQAVLAGGARMFTFERAVNVDIGKSNLAAVRAALADAGVPIRAEATRGATGRTVRICQGVVSIRTGGSDSELYRAPWGDLVTGSVR